MFGSSIATHVCPGPNPTLPLLRRALRGTVILRDAPDTDGVCGGAGGGVVEALLGGVGLLAALGGQGGLLAEAEAGRRVGRGGRGRARTGYGALMVRWRGGTASPTKTPQATTGRRSLAWSAG